MKLTIVWDKQALFQLQDIYDYLKKKSPKAANKVKNAILKEIRNLPIHPEKYSPDHFKYPKDDRYRAFEIYHIRTSYSISDFEIRILGIRHASRKPKIY